MTTTTNLKKMEKLAKEIKKDEVAKETKEIKKEEVAKETKEIKKEEVAKETKEDISLILLKRDLAEKECRKQTNQMHYAVGYLFGMFLGILIGTKIKK